MESTTAWERLAHSATLLGYGQLVSFMTLIFIAWLSTLEWTKRGADNVVPRLENWTLLKGIVFPYFALCALAGCFHVYQASAFPDSGPRLSRVACIVGLISSLVVYGVQAAILSAGTDSRYYGLDLVLLYFSGAITVAMNIGIRNEMVKDESGFGSSPQAQVVAHDNDDEPGKAKTTRTVIQALFDISNLFANVTIAFAYPFGIIPLFFSSSTTTRIFICLVLHPVLLEVAEALGRGSSADQIMCDLLAGKITLAVAECRIVQASVLQYGLKQDMAFYRRFMLLNMGSADATLVALVVTAIEEAAARGFLVQIDTTIRSLRGLPELTGDELRLQRLTWMCDTNQSCIAEFNAILTSSFAYVLLQRHAVIFAIGYEVNQELDTATVFVQLLVELALEMLVDNTTMWAETEHDIPVARYFTFANGFPVFGYHAAVSTTALCISLYAFIRHPHFTFCDSNDVCNCLDKLVFQEWFGDTCQRGSASATPESGSNLLKLTQNLSDNVFFAPSASTSNDTSSLNSTDSIDLTNDLLENVDFVAVLLTLIAGIASFALIVLAVFFARYRKRKQVVTALSNSVQIAEQEKLEAQATNRALKEKLGQAQRTVDEITSESASQLKPYCIKFDELTFIDEIGHGSFGVVWKGMLHNKPVAIKTVRVTKVTESVVKDFMKEIKLMAPLRHEFLVNLIGGCWEDGPDNLCIVLEYCGRGSLKNLLSDQHSGYSWKTPYYAITLGVALCFRYLHHEQPSGEPLIHRDLKPDNVMMCDDLSPRVGDFGESTRFDQNEAMRRLADNEGTPLYTAPEVLVGSRCEYNSAIDVYSFAITLLEIGCRDHHAIMKQFVANTRFVATTGWRPEPTAELVEEQTELWALIQACWHSDPNSRPNFVQIVGRVEALNPAQDAISPASEKFSARRALMTEVDVQAAELWTRESGKKFVAFLSHHKAACATEARFVKSHLEDLFDADVFLDSDNLRDLRGLLEHVVEASVVVLFQSEEVLMRTWCLLELYTAVTSGIPIVALSCVGKDYDFAKSADLLAHLETRLKPSTLSELRANDVDPLDIAHVLFSTIPNIISVPFDTSGSRTAIAATMVDLVRAMCAAKPMPVRTTREQWLKKRAAHDTQRCESPSKGTLRGTQKGILLERANRVDELEAENASLKSELSSLTRLLSTAGVDLSEAKDELSQTRAELAVERTRGSALAKQVDDLKETLADKNGQLKVKDDQIAKLFTKF